MAANITAKLDFELMHLTPEILLMTKAAQSDWFSYAGAPGIIFFGGTSMTAVADTITNTTEVPTYGAMKANGAVAATTTTSIVFDAATGITRILPYYIFNSTTQEFMLVTGDDTPGGASGTLTVVRGALGSTATAIADNAPLYVLNQIFLGSASAGATLALVVPLPNDPKTPLFKAKVNA